MSLTTEDLQQIKALLAEQSTELKAHTSKAIDDLSRDVLAPSFEHLERHLDAIENVLVEDRLPAVKQELEKLETFQAALRKAQQPQTRFATE